MASTKDFLCFTKTLILERIFFFSLTSTDDIKDKDTIKVVRIVDSPVITLSFTDVGSSTPYCSETSMHDSETTGSSWKTLLPLDPRIH